MAGAALAAEGQVFKSPSCDCCSKWIAHMSSNGFKLEPKDIGNSELTRLKATLGLKREQASCHTAMIEGYVIEGHVPAGDVERLLKERPDAIGLSVPGMPVGSPGMEMDGQNDAYDVLLIRKDGTAEVFSSH